MRKIVPANSTAELIDATGYREFHLDVGCGRGNFLIHAARQHPDKLFVGVEINSLTHEILCDRLAREDLKNIRVICNEGYSFIRDHVPSDCVDGVHVYFPTPYLRPLNQLAEVKTKAKSLLLVHRFLAQCKRTLKTGGALRVVTDHHSYIRRARRYAKEVGLDEVPWTSPIKCDDLSHIIGTGCEIEMLSLGKRIYSMKFM